MKEYSVASTVNDPALDIALATLREQKQAIMFVNTKRGAESSAEKLAKKCGLQKEKQKQLAQEILDAVSSPTKQCRRLAYCVERGTAFHHSGLTSKQRHIIETGFLVGDIGVICATPTLAAGINLPAFRVIIRDLKRFTGAGMSDIPVLEYLQMSGRAGRPDFNDDFGEAIILAKNESEAQKITDKYIFGDPESIYSKVAAMPVLRTYCLSLVATEFVHTRSDLLAFFSETFFAHQYGDMKGIEAKIDDTLLQLAQWGFFQGAANTSDDFVSAQELRAPDNLAATPLGRRVSELYLDPLTASELIKGLMRLSSAPFFSYLHLVCSAQEMRPLLRIKIIDYETLEPVITTATLLKQEPSIYDTDYEQFLAAIKTAKLLDDWADEQSEEYLLEHYDARPGELRARIAIADWLLYAAAEIARLLKRHQHVAPLQKARTRLEYGVKEELLALLRFKGVGRVRSRLLFRNGIRTAGDIKKTDASTLSALLGPKLTTDLKAQVGQKVEEESLSPRKRKGQLSLDAKRFS